MKPFLILLLPEIKLATNGTRKECKAPVKSPPLGYQHSVVCRPDAVAVSQPTLSKAPQGIRCFDCITISKQCLRVIVLMSKLKVWMMSAVHCSVWQHWMQWRSGLCHAPGVQSKVSRSEPWHSGSPELMLHGRNAVQHVRVLDGLWLDSASSASAELWQRLLWQGAEDVARGHRKSTEKVRWHFYVPCYCHRWSYLSSVIDVKNHKFILLCADLKYS